MINSNKILEMKDICDRLSNANLKYLKAVAEALDYAHETIKQQLEKQPA